MAKKNALSSLMPRSIVQHQGSEIRIPTTKEEAALLNILGVEQLREQYFLTMKKWKDGEVIPTPKELRDMAAAIRDLNESCNAVFADPKTSLTEKDETKSGEVIDFSQITNVTPEPEKKE